MAWGKPSTASPAATASELVAKASATNSIVVLPFRTFADAEMTALCGLLAAAPAITAINSSGKALGAEGAAALGALLSSGRCALRKLAVGDATFAESGGLRTLAGSVEASCPLHVLDLGYKGLDGARDGTSALTPLLSRCADLRDLTLSRNPELGAAGVAALVASGCLGASCTLTRVEVSESGLGGAAIAALAAAATTGMRSLDTLLLARNPAIGADGPQGATALGRLMASLPALRCIHLQECALATAAAAALASALGGAHMALGEVRLCGNDGLFADAQGEGGGNVEALPASFIESALPTRIEYEASLRLPHTERAAAERVARASTHSATDRVTGSTTVGANGGAGLALLAALGACPRLSTLSMGSCALTDHHASALRRAARGRLAPAGGTNVVCVADLDVRSNRLSAAGAADLLIVSGIERLALFDNPPIGTSAAGSSTALRAALGQTACLHTLDLGACGLNTPTLKEVCTALCGGAAPLLRCLELFGNGQEDGDAWKAVLAELREERDEIDVAWKEPAGDAPSE